MDTLFLGYNISIAVVVGFIALAGLDAETGVVMLIYLDHAYKDKEARVKGQGSGVMTMKDIYEAVMEGAVNRVRPKVMTITAIIAGLLPIMWSTGTGADVMKRIAAPMVGGMVTSGLLELLVIPAIYVLWKGRGMKEGAAQRSLASCWR